jgi:hypothetical protein
MTKLITRGSTLASLTIGLLVGCLLGPLSQGVQAQTDPLIGTWRLNVAKSKFDPGPPPMAETRIYEAFGNGIKSTQTRVEAGGNKSTISYSALYDGKDYPYMGSPDADTIALRRVDANTIEATLKKSGKVTLNVKAVMSADRKTRTLTMSGTNAKGQRVNNVTIWERQ